MTWVPIKPVAGQADTPAALALVGHARRLRNVYYSAARYIRRMGAQVLHSSEAPDTLLGLWALKSVWTPTLGASVVSVFAGTAGSESDAPQVLLQGGSVLNRVPYNGITVTGTQLNASHFPWIAAELNNTSALICKRGLLVSEEPRHGVLMHCTSTQVTRAGISAPTVAAAVSDSGVAGALTGTWNAFAYSFLTADGHESNAIYTFGNVVVAAKKLRWASLQTPTNPRVTHWRLYRAKVGAANTVAFEMTDIPVTTALPYDEELADSTLGFRTPPTTNLPPPLDPEHVCIWDEVSIVTSNDPAFGGSGWPYSYVDDNLIPQFEAFDADRRVLRIPPRGGQRAMMSVPWDAQGLKRLALVTDAAIYIATPDGTGGYAIDDLDLKHGVPGPQAAAAGGGWLVWCDGYRVLASNGSTPTIVSTDSVEAALRSMPGGLADRIAVAYRRSENSFFSISFPSTAASTRNDLELWWFPDERGNYVGGWNEARYLEVDGTGYAPLCYGSAPSGTTTRIGLTPGAIDLATFYNDNRVFWLDSVALRDEGPRKVVIDVEFPPTVDDNGQRLIASRAMVDFEHRRDTAATSDVDPELSFQLHLDDDRSTSAVAAVRDHNTLSARASSLGDPARTIGLRVYGPCEPAIEITAGWLDVAPVGLRVKV